MNADFISSLLTPQFGLPDWAEQKAESDAESQGTDVTGQTELSLLIRT